MKKITDFSKGFWEGIVECKAADPLLLRYYDILKERERGLTLKQIAIKHGLTKMSISKIVNKYRKP